MALRQRWGSDRNGVEADAVSLKLMPARQENEGKAGQGQHSTASGPRPLINHEAGCRPTNDAGALSHPNDANQQCK
jgi:hypothetical protein